MLPIRLPAALCVLLVTSELKFPMEGCGSLGASDGIAAAAQPGNGPVGEFERLHDSFRYTEGPEDDGKGNLYFSDTPANRVYRQEPRTALVN